MVRDSVQSVEEVPSEDVLVRVGDVHHVEDDVLCSGVHAGTERDRLLDLVEGIDGPPFEPAERGSALLELVPRGPHGFECVEEEEVGQAAAVHQDAADVCPVDVGGDDKGVPMGVHLCMAIFLCEGDGVCGHPRQDA